MTEVENVPYRCGYDWNILLSICSIYNFLFCTVHLHVDLNVLKLVHEIKHNGYIYSIILTGVDLHPVTSYKLCDCGCLTLDSG